MRKFVIIATLASALMAGSAHSQRPGQSQGYSPEAMAKFAADTLRHKVDIYVETTRAIQDGEGTPQQKRAQIDANMYYTAMCSIERNILHQVTGEPSLAEDAMRLVNHYDYLAQAMERMGLMSADKARADYLALRPQGEAQLGELYKKGSDGTDAAAKTQMLKFSDTCRQVTLAARNVDAMAMKRHTGR